MARVVALIENKEMASDLRHCLTECGHEAVLAGSLTDAKAALANHPDLVVSEVHLVNGGSVFDFLQFSKSQPAMSDIPFVLLSVKPSKVANVLRDSLLFTASHLGAAKYISMEEFDCATLVRELQEFFDGKVN